MQSFCLAPSCYGNLRFFGNHQRFFPGHRFSCECFYGYIQSTRKKCTLVHVLSTQTQIVKTIINFSIPNSFELKTDAFSPRAEDSLF